MKKLILFTALTGILPSHKLITALPVKQIANIKQQPNRIFEDPYVQSLIEQELQQSEVRLGARLRRVEKALYFILPVLACGIFSYLSRD